MITVSSGFKTAVKSNVRYARSYLDIYEYFVPSNTLYPATNIYPKKTYKSDTISDSDYLLEWEINEHIDIGKTCMRIANITTLDDYQLESKEVNVFGGIKLADNSVEYVNLGNFIIKKPTTKNYGKEAFYEANDYMLKFQQDYSSSLTYPATLLQIVQEICTNLEMELGNTNFFNYDLSIPTSPDTTGLKYRDILKWIAEASLTFCKIGNDNKLYFNTFIASSETIDGNYYSDLYLEKKYGPINAVYLKSNKASNSYYSKDDPSVAANGETAITITDNQLLEDIRETIVDSMLTQISGLEYYPFEIDWTNWLYLETGDTIAVKDINDTSFSTVILDQQRKFNGALKGNIKAEVSTQVQTEYQGNTDINKLNARKVGNDEIISRINATPESIKIQAQKIALEGYTTINDGFSVDLEGNMTCNNATITGATLKLGNNTQIVGDDGLLTNLDTEASNKGFLTPSGIIYGAFFLGYNTDLATNWGNFMEFDMYIPTNFTIKEARITLIHTPVNWDNGGDYDVWGYCRNLKAYSITNANNIFIGSAYAGEYGIIDDPTLSEISGAFGVNGFTASIPSDLSYQTETVISSDIKSAFIVGTNNKIAVKSSDAIPTFNPDFATNCSNIGVKTGFVRGMLTVIGYYNYE